MTIINSAKSTLTRNLSISLGIVTTSVLVGCGGSSSTTTETDFQAVDITQPVSDWVMVWNDEFDGATIDSSKWSHEVDCGGGGNQEQQCYTDSAENSFIADGMLNIVAKPAEEGAQKPYTSARLRTKDKGDWTYGRFEMRAKLPSGQGSWPAFWMLPTDEVYGGWPRSGEIDIIESVNLKAAGADGPEAHVYGTLHYGRDWPNNDSSGQAYLLPDGMNPADDFHTYAIEWQEGEIRWYVDDYLYATQMQSEVRYQSDGQAAGLVHRGWYSENFDIISGELETQWGSAPYDQDFHILLNFAVGGDWPENVNETGVDAAAFAEGQSFVIDYVRVYECSLNPNTGAGCETVRAGYKDEETLVEGAAPTPPPPTTDGPVADLIIFNDAENSNWPAWNCCSDPEPMIVTDDADHNEVVEFTIDATPTVVGFNTGEAENGVGFNASSFLTSGNVTFDMKVVSAPSDPSSTWMFKIESNGTSEAVEVPLSTSTEGLAPVTGEWQTYTFSLQSLADAGLDLSNIDVVMIFPAWDTGDGAVFRVDNVEIGSGGTVASPELVLFEDNINTDWPLWDCCGSSTPTEESDDAEHGITAEFVIGSSPTVMGFITRSSDGGSDMPFNASSLLADGVIEFEMKVVNAPVNTASTWMFKVESGGGLDNGGSAVEVALTTSTEGVAPVTGEWQTYTFPLQTLFDAGLDLSAIDVVMIFPAWDTGDGAVYRVDNAKIYNPNATSTPAGSSINILQDTLDSNWAIWDCCGGSTPTIETDDADHGVTAEFVIGASPTVMGVITRSGDGGGDAPFNASSILSTGNVTFDMKVVSAPIDTSSTWLFKIESSGGPDNGGTAVELPLTDSLEGTAPVTGEWQTYTFPLQSLFDAGLDISAIDVIMFFPAWDTGNGAVYRVDNISISAP